MARPKSGFDPVEVMTKSLAGMPGIGEKLRGPVQEMMKARRRPGDSYADCDLHAGDGRCHGRGGPAGCRGCDGSGGAFGGGSAGLAVRCSCGISNGGDGGFAQRAFPGRPGADGRTEGRDPSRRDGGSPTAGSGSRPGVYRVGRDVTAPQLLERTEPSYTEEARAARIQGSVLLYVVVQPDGTTGQIKVLRSLDVGLDQKAVEAVSTWKFKPGTKDGQPVPFRQRSKSTFACCKLIRLHAVVVAGFPLRLQ